MYVSSLQDVLAARAECEQRTVGAQDLITRGYFIAHFNGNRSPFIKIKKKYIKKKKLFIPIDYLDYIHCFTSKRKLKTHLLREIREIFSPSLFGNDTLTIENVFYLAGQYRDCQQ